MQPAIHDCTDMAVRVLESPGCRGLGERLEEVALLLTDGSVWLLPSIFVKVGEQSLSLRCAAWSLKAQRLGQRPHGHWRMIAPPAKASHAPGQPAATAAR